MLWWLQMSPQTAADLIDALEASHRHFEAAVHGLSDSDALKKPAPEQWSAMDCIEHVCITESLGVKRLQAAESTPDPQINAAREAAMAARVMDRSVKIQGPPIAMPTGRHATLADALAAFALLARVPSTL